MEEELKNINLEKDPGQEVDRINLNMMKFHDNNNEIGKLYNEFTNSYGKEYYLASLANSLLNSFKTFEKFYVMVEDKENFSNELVEISNDAIELLHMDTNETLKDVGLFKRRRILKKQKPKNQEKLKKVLDKIDEINDLITASVEQYSNKN